MYDFAIKNMGGDILLARNVIVKGLKKDIRKIQKGRKIMT
jgi:hypothetical protein